MPFGHGMKVAIIGAGISGVCTAAHLLKEGLQPTVFERSSVAGGVWHFDERVADDPSFPSETPSKGDYVPSIAGQFAYRTPSPDDADSGQARQGKDAHPLATADDAALEISFSPPGPCYAGLRNNVPTGLMVSSLGGWPDGTPENTSQADIERYVQELASIQGVNEVTWYNTRVEDVRKSVNAKRWTVRTIMLEKKARRPRLVEKTWEFDAVVVASGHYNLPRIPDIEGLKEWKHLFPDQVIHSKQYRKPGGYRGKNVFVIGAGVSALDICKELNGIATKSYQSARGGNFDLPPTWLPENGERVGEVASFVLDHEYPRQENRDGETPIPGKILLKDGRALTDIHRVIVATGYITSYPFLSYLHSDATAVTDADQSTLVTADGDMAHNLHKDIFYIPDPTLSFVGVPYHTATFSLFDFQAQIVARVLSGRACLPSEEDMRLEYEDRIRSNGVGRGFHSLRGEGAEVAYVNDLVGWANRDAVLNGSEPMQGHTERWIEVHIGLKQRMRKLWGGTET